MKTVSQRRDDQLKNLRSIAVINFTPLTLKEQAQFSICIAVGLLCVALMQLTMRVLIPQWTANRYIWQLTVATSCHYNFELKVGEALHLLMFFILQGLRILQQNQFISLFHHKESIFFVHHSKVGSAGDERGTMLWVNVCTGLCQQSMT